MKMGKKEFTIGFVIKQARKEKHLTVEQLANAIGVSKGTISKWENGNIKNMGIDRMLSLSRILNLDPIEILENDNDKSNEQISVQEAQIEIKSLLDKTDMSESQKTMILAPLNYISEEIEKEK